MSRSTRLRPGFAVVAVYLLVQTGSAWAQGTFWLNDDFDVVAKAQASRKATVADERDGPGWPVEIRRIRYDQLNFRGYSSTPDLADPDQKWVGAYQLYRFAGDYRLVEVGTRNMAGELNGLSVGFDRDGDLSYETPYVNGVMQGMGRRYVGGELRYLTPLVDGKREGFETSYYDGRIRKLTEVHNNKIDGVVEQYGSLHSPQVLTQRSHYRNGRLDGWERVWSLEGALLQETHYVNGRKNGIQRNWLNQAAGQLASVYRYDDGQLRGLQQYYSGGRLDEERMLGDDGQRLRRTQFWPIAGSPRKAEDRLETDAQGRRRRVDETFSNTGHLLTRHISFRDAPHYIKTHYSEDGQVIYRKEVVDGKPSGLQVEQTFDGQYEWRRYDDQGRLHGEQADYRNGEPVRQWTMNHGEPVDDSQDSASATAD
ncbi:outer membrane morn variant repeat-containing protein [Salinisphaera sp. S4-8]|uniref:toxin-antitoxin system YwqK family antitoxin n=1 Tax=Salinisphaera sp. S4-8 TaxID=633357 RepID=UPI003341B996